MPTEQDDVEVLWQELRSATDVIARQGEILTEVVNALRGPPPEGTQWSHNDAGELAQAAALRARPAVAVEALTRAVHGALTAAAASAAYVGLLQSCLVTDEDGEPTGEARTLIDGYFDLRRAAEDLHRQLGPDAAR